MKIEISKRGREEVLIVVCREISFLAAKSINQIYVAPKIINESEALLRAIYSSACMAVSIFSLIGTVVNPCWLRE